MQIFTYLFLPKDAVEACGMFTSDHFIILFICLIAVSVMLYISRNIKKEKIRKITIWLALIITLLEIIKIIYNFAHGYYWIDAWLPISFCSIFIYALWLSSFGHGLLKKSADAFISSGCLLAGLGFLIFPTTSLMDYPVWHYLSIYSMVFHTLMIYMGILFIRNEIIIINKEAFKAFCLFFLFFASIAIILNSTTSSNIMLLREPYNLPFKSLQSICESYPYIYTSLVMALYIVGPFTVSLVVDKTLKMFRLKKHNRKMLEKSN